MDTHELLGQLSGLQQMLTHLIESVDESEARVPYVPYLPSLIWLYGRAAYIETYWLREVVMGDDQITHRVRHIFGPDAQLGTTLYSKLPPMEHLLNWALELHDHNLTLLANPDQLPAHPLRENDRLLNLIVEEYSRIYELMLGQLAERQTSLDHEHTVAHPIVAAAPNEEHVDILQGHYRIGAKDDPAATDCELPPNIVELHAFRIDLLPATNAAYLGFMEDLGYETREYWTEEGWLWRTHRSHPHHWRRDVNGHWYGIGVNGPFGLTDADPVSGITHYEAHAYANWVGSHGGRLAGAVVQHEYQWEAAARSQQILGIGRVWEWCANPFHPYTGYKPPADPEAQSRGFDRHYPLRGGSLHTRPLLRRLSYRNHALPQACYFNNGIRLVYPPSTMPWEKQH